MNCSTYILRINGEELTFNSKAQLSEFMLNNRNILPAMKHNRHIRFSASFDAQADTFAKLVNMKANAPEAKIEYDEEGRRQVTYNGNRYIPVTRAITNPRYGEPIGNGRFKPMVTGFSNDYFAVYADSLVDKINPLTSNIYTEQEIADKIETMKRNFKTMAKLGTAIHKVAEVFFDDVTQTKQQVIDKLRGTREFNDLPIQAMDNIIDNMRKIHATLDAAFPGAKYISETTLTTSNEHMDNFIGKVDLMLVDKNNNVHIFDFKTSPKNYEDFDQAKELSTDYQLGFYDAMLEQQGISTSRTFLGVIPIKIEDIDYENGTFAGITLDDNVYDIRNSNESTTNYGRASASKFAPGQYLRNNIRRVVERKGVSFSVNTDSVNEMAAIDQRLWGVDMVRANGFYSEAQIEHKKKKCIFQNKKTGLWHVKNLFSGTVSEGYISESKAIEEFERINQANEGKALSYVTEVIADIRRIMASESKLIEFPGKQSSKAEAYRRLYGEYIANGWVIDDSLSFDNVIIWRNDNYGVLDAMTVVNDDLNRQIETMTYGKNGLKITGNLCKDSDSNIDTNILDATVANVQLMRLMTRLSNYMRNNKDLKIRRLSVVSNGDDTIQWQLNNVLRKNYRTLIQKHNIANPDNKIENMFEDANEPIQFLDSFEQINMIINESTVEGRKDPQYIKAIREGIAGYENLKSQERLAKFEELSEILIAHAGLKQDTSYLNWVVNELSKDSPEYKLHRAVAEAIMQETMFMEIMYRRKAGIFDSDQITPKQLTSNPVLKELQNKIGKQMRQEIQDKCYTELQDAKNFCEDYIRDGGFVDSTFKIFDSIIEADEGHPPVFRIVDYRTAPLADYERVFAEKWLRFINARRYPATKGDINHEDAEELVRTGEWFDIPLLRGGFIDKSRDGVFKGIKRRITDVFDEYIDPIFSETGKLSEQGSKLRGGEDNKFVKYFNAMKLNSGVRNNRLASKGINYYSHNLAEIAMAYGFEDIQERVYNKALPIIRNALVLQKMAASMYAEEKELNDAVKYLEEVWQVEIYKKDISSASDTVKKMYGVWDKMISHMTMTWNLPMFLREMVTGGYINMARIAAGFGGKDAPDVESVIKAYGIVLGQTGSGIFNENWLNGLNRMFNTGGRAKGENLEIFRAQRGNVVGSMFTSKAFYGLASLPDYIHRQALLVAWMIKNNCIDAYVWDENARTTVYDFTKDKRFDFIPAMKQGGGVPEGRGRDLSTYRVLLEESNKKRADEGQELLQFGDAVDHGITINQISTILNVSNQMHGNMDTDTQMHWRNRLSGRFFTKFKMFTSSRLMNWALTTGKYQATHLDYKIDEVTGKPLYFYRRLNSDTNLWEVGETTNLNEDGCTGERVYSEQIYQESGNLASLSALMTSAYDLFKGDKSSWTELQQDEQKMANLKFLFGDLIAYLIALLMLKPMIDTMREDNKVAGKMAQAASVDPFRENNPFELLSSVIDTVNTPNVSITKRLFNSTVKLATSDTYNTNNYIAQNFGLGKIIQET